MPQQTGLGWLLDKVLAGSASALVVFLFLLFALPLIIRYVRSAFREEMKMIVSAKDETIRAKDQTIQTKDSVIGSLKEQLGVSNETFAKRIEQQQQNAQHEKELLEQSAAKLRQEAEQAQGELKKELEAKTRSAESLAIKAKLQEERLRRISEDYSRAMAEIENLKRQANDTEAKATFAQLLSGLGGGLMGSSSSKTLLGS